MLIDRWFSISILFLFNSVVSLNQSEFSMYWQLLTDPYAKTIAPSNQIKTETRKPFYTRPFALQLARTNQLGLPKCQQEQQGCQTIGIVGAGVAGLYCGILLAEAGHRVKIFEASDRAGGRIFTYRDNENPTLYMGEFGAMRFLLNMQPYLSHLIQQRYQLDTSEFVNSNNNGYVYFNGIRARVKEFYTNPNLFNFNLTESEREKKPMNIFSDALIPVLNSLEKGGWLLARDQWDPYSLENYLYRMNVSQNARNFIYAIRGSEYTHQVSILAHIRSTFLFDSGTKFYRIQGGNDQLIQAMVDECQRILSDHCSIVYSSPVTQVVTNHSNWIQLTTRNGTNESFNTIVVATTATAAQLIDFKPRTEFKEKYRAFRQIHYECAMKILLFFNHSWWATQENIHGGQSITDLNLRQVYYPATLNNQTNGGTLIASYITGYGSLLWQSLSDDDTIELALKQLIELHPSSSNLRDFYQRGRVHHWCADPYAHGAFAYLLPLQETRFLNEFQTPVERVYFISEHTTLMNAWVEGSLVSAVRAALDISREQEKIFDVIIMGGNLLGLTTAMFLSMKHPQWRIAIVDRGVMSDWNRSSSSTLHQRRFRRIYTQDHLTELANLSLSLWRQIEQQLNVTRGSILNTDDGFLFFGRYNTSRMTNEDDLASIKHSCHHLHQDCEYLNSSQLHNRYPFFTLPTDYEGIFDQHSGFINLTQLLSSLFTYINQNSNIILREQEEFLSFRLLNNETSMIITDRGVLLASKRVVFLPGSYAKNVSYLLNFDLDVSLWELSIFHFRHLPTVKRSPTWIEFGNHEQQDVFSGFSIDPAADHFVIEPIFMGNSSNALTYPLQKTNRIDGSVRQPVMSWAEKSLRGLVDLSDVFAFDNETYLWTSIRGGGFILDYVPETNQRILIHTTSVGTSFVAVWPDMLTEMITSQINETHRYTKYLPYVSLRRLNDQINETIVSNARCSWTFCSECFLMFFCLLISSVFV